MKVLVAIVLVSIVSGCSGGIYTPVVDMEVGFKSSLLGHGGDVPVVYPAAKTVYGHDPMVEAFGPSWRNVQDDYPGFTFNP